MTRSEATKLPVAIIGAGSSGVTTGKALGQRGLPFEILEKGSQLGGMWRYENDSGTSLRSSLRSQLVASCRSAQVGLRPGAVMVADLKS